MSRQQEHYLQVACVNYFRMQYPRAFIYAIPNAGQRSIAAAAYMKAEGLVSGVPDLHIPVSKCGYNSLYIEMKNGKQGRVSENQKTVMETLSEHNNLCVVCRTFEEFKKTVDEYMSGAFGEPLAN